MSVMAANHETGVLQPLAEICCDLPRCSGSASRRCGSVGGETAGQLPGLRGGGTQHLGSQVPRTGWHRRTARPPGCVAPSRALWRVSATRIAAWHRVGRAGGRHVPCAATLGAKRPGLARAARPTCGINSNARLVTRIAGATFHGDAVPRLPHATNVFFPHAGSTGAGYGARLGGGSLFDGFRLCEWIFRTVSCPAGNGAPGGSGSWVAAVQFQRPDDCRGRQPKQWIASLIVISTYESVDSSRKPASTSRNG